MGYIGHKDIGWEEERETKREMKIKREIEWISLTNISIYISIYLLSHFSLSLSLSVSLPPNVLCPIYIIEDYLCRI